MAESVKPIEPLSPSCLDQQIMTSREQIEVAIAAIWKLFDPGHTQTEAVSSAIASLNERLLEMDINSELAPGIEAAQSEYSGLVDLRAAQVCDRKYNPPRIQPNMAIESLGMIREDNRTFINRYLAFPEVQAVCYQLQLDEESKQPPNHDQLEIVAVQALINGLVPSQMKEDQPGLS